MGRPSDIRDLIAQLRTVALNHPAYSQVVEVLRNAFNHCAAIARIEEMNDDEDNRRFNKPDREGS
jgi:hypothetical protein